MDQKPDWIEVSLTVDGELAEAVAEVLARFAPGGVVVESTAIRDDPAGEGSPAGPLRVVAYLPADDQWEATRDALERALWYLGRIRPLPEPNFRPVVDADWTRAWKSHFQPVPVGRRLLVQPPWAQVDPGERVPVLIDPGMAFGVGTHPSTRLCLEIIEERLVPGEALIDVGCGSGILAIAGLKLGAARALGVDTDPQALDNARANARLNDVEERLELGAGSVAEILAGGFSLQQAPLVVANILAPVIVDLLAQGLGRLLTPGGTLVLSGVLEEQEAGVRDALQEAGFSGPRRRVSDDWVALVAE